MTLFIFKISNTFPSTIHWQLTLYHLYIRDVSSKMFWKTLVKSTFFKSIAVLQDFSFLQYCNTPILDLKKYCNSNEILKKVLQYWFAILQYCNTERLVGFLTIVYMYVRQVLIVRDPLWGKIIGLDFSHIPYFLRI